MERDDFIKKLEVELKISKNSPYTIRNYIRANETLMDFTGKIPDEITSDDVKLYMADNLSERASASIILFLSAIRYAFLAILEKDPTAKIKRPKKEYETEKGK